MHHQVRWLRGLALLAALAAACGDDDGGTNQNNQNDNQNQGLPCLPYFTTSASGETCVHTPLTETTRTACGDIWEDCDSSGISAPVLTCLGVPDDPPASPPTVTLQGFIDVFSSGPDPTGIKVQVFRAADLEGVERIDGSVTALGEDVLQSADLEGDVAAGRARACFNLKDDIANNQAECPLPTDDCGGCDDALTGDEFCFQGTCYERLRYEGRYSVAGVPTHEPLVIRTVGVGDYTDPTWAIMVQVNVYLRTTDPTYDASAGTYELDAQLISRQDWLKIPPLLGLSGGMSAGYGAIAGEAHDCLGTRLTGAQVGVFPQSTYFAYFNDNPLDTVPVTSRLPDGTDQLGTYAMFELPAGPIDVETWGLLGGVATLLGQHHTFIFEDSVTVLSINDGMPTSSL